MSQKTQSSPLTENEIVKFLEDNGAPAVILRKDVAKYSCKFLNPSTLRNADSLGSGPSERIIFGDKKKAVGYPLKSLAGYMVRRGFVIERRD